MSTFFIKRPIFAIVLSLMITIFGLISLKILPIQSYPEVAPPLIVVNAKYPGASAYDVEEAVTRPLEDKINGVQGMLYMESSSTSSGLSSIKIYFEPGYDQSMAAVDVQNQVALAEPQLPPEVKQQGVKVKKRSPSMVAIVGLHGNGNPQYDEGFLVNYITINILDELRRIPGVGKVETLGGKMYSMRVWLDPQKLRSLSLNPSEVVAAIKSQNRQAALGSLGKMPTLDTQKFEFTLSTKGRLTDAKEFENIVIKNGKNGKLVYLRDIARVELGALDYTWGSSFNNEPAGMIAIKRLPGANSLEIKKKVAEAMERLSDRFPEGITHSIPYDTTKFIEVSIENVFHTLFEAILLVIIVMYVFLQSMRPTIIATIAIPVSIIGAFLAMQGLGFSINFLTLFGLVLAIGIVVDDAILVVEQVETELHKNPEFTSAQAAKAAMKKMTGPILGTTAVMFAVFIPVSMMPGLTGTMYQQFALTIVASVLISAINALSLSPAIAAIVMKRQPAGHKKMIFHRGFDKVFNWVLSGYTVVLTFLIKIRWLVILLVVISYGGLYYMFKTVPTGFVPSEDQGVIMMAMNMRPGTALPQTKKARYEVVERVRTIEGIKDVIAVDGFNAISGTQDSSSVGYFVTLSPWEERTTPEIQVNSILAQIRQKTASLDDAQVVAFNIPGIPGLGVVGGFAYRLEDYLSGDINKLFSYAQKLLGAAREDPRIARAFTTFNPNYPTYSIDIDREKLNSLGVELPDLFSAMQIYLGSMYVNDFTLYGKIFRVLVQADMQFRKSSSDIDHLSVRSSSGEMVPISSLVKIEESIAPQVIKHYNLYRTIDLSGVPAPGFSSGDAMNAMEEASKKLLSKEYGYEWTGLSLQERLAGNAQMIIFAFSLLAIFLFLSAMYESWVLPMMIMLSVPVVMLGAIYGVSLFGMANNLYVQIGMVVLMGLASKNAIVIISFAKELRESGMSILDSGIQSGVQRFRAIMMTVLSFVFGIFPLVVASGAGAMTQQSVGITVLSGMITATFVSTLLVPVFYVALEEIREKFVSVEDEIAKRESL